MERLIKRVFIFLSLFVLLLLIILNFTIYWVNNPKYYLISDSYTSIIMGHSHPECALNDSLLNGFKNYAEQGEAYIYTYYKLKKILEANTQIKNIYVEFSNNQINTIMDKWVYDDKFISEKFSKNYPIIPIETCFNFLEKNPASTINAIITGTTEHIRFILKNESSKHVKWGGFQPHSTSKVDSIIKALPISSIKEQAISEINILYLKKIIQLCKENNKNIYLIRSPLHKKYFDLVDEKQFQHTLEKNFSSISFLDFSSVPIKNEEFLDLEHLNSYGAKKFSIFFKTFINNGGLINHHPQNIIDSLSVIPQINE